MRLFVLCFFVCLLITVCVECGRSKSSTKSSKSKSSSSKASSSSSKASSSSSKASSSSNKGPPSSHHKHSKVGKKDDYSSEERIIKNTKHHRDDFAEHEREANKFESDSTQVGKLSSFRKSHRNFTGSQDKLPLGKYNHRNHSDIAHYRNHSDIAHYRNHSDIAHHRNHSDFAHHRNHSNNAHHHNHSINPHHHNHSDVAHHRNSGNSTNPGSLSFKRLINQNVSTNFAPSFRNASESIYGTDPNVRGAHFLPKNLSLSNVTKESHSDIRISNISNLNTSKISSSIQNLNDGWRFRNNSNSNGNGGPNIGNSSCFNKNCGWKFQNISNGITKNVSNGRTDLNPSSYWRVPNNSITDMKNTWNTKNKTGFDPNHDLRISSNSNSDTKHLWTPPSSIHASPNYEWKINNNSNYDTKYGWNVPNGTKFNSNIGWNVPSKGYFESDYMKKNISPDVKMAPLFHSYEKPSAPVQPYPLVQLGQPGVLYHSQPSLGWNTNSGSMNPQTNQAVMSSYFPAPPQVSWVNAIHSQPKFNHYNNYDPGSGYLSSKKFKKDKNKKNKKNKFDLSLEDLSIEDIDWDAFKDSVKDYVKDLTHSNYHAELKNLLAQKKIDKFPTRKLYSAMFPRVKQRLNLKQFSTKANLPDFSNKSFLGHFSTPVDPKAFAGLAGEPSIAGSVRTKREFSKKGQAIAKEINKFLENERDCNETLDARKKREVHVLEITKFRDGKRVSEGVEPVIKNMQINEVEAIVKSKFKILIFSSDTKSLRHEITTNKNTTEINMDPIDKNFFKNGKSNEFMKLTSSQINGPNIINRGNFSRSKIPRNSSYIDGGLSDKYTNITTVGDNKQSNVSNQTSKTDEHVTKLRRVHESIDEFKKKRPQAVATKLSPTNESLDLWRRSSKVDSERNYAELLSTEYLPTTDILDRRTRALHEGQTNLVSFGSSNDFPRNSLVNTSSDLDAVNKMSHSAKGNSNQKFSLFYTDIFKESTDFVNPNSIELMNVLGSSSSISIRNFKKTGMTTKSISDGVTDGITFKNENSEIYSAGFKWNKGNKVADLKEQNENTKSTTSLIYSLRSQDNSETSLVTHSSSNNIHNSSTSLDFDTFNGRIENMGKTIDSEAEKTLHLKSTTLQNWQEVTEKPFHYLLTSAKSVAIPPNKEVNEKPLENQVTIFSTTQTTVDLPSKTYEKDSSNSEEDKFTSTIDKDIFGSLFVNASRPISVRIVDIRDKETEKPTSSPFFFNFLTMSGEKPSDAPVLIQAPLKSVPCPNGKRRVKGRCRVVWGGW